MPFSSEQRAFISIRLVACTSVSEHWQVNTGVSPSFAVLTFGSGQQYELLDWLSNVTFPMEKEFADPGFARDTYPSVVRRIINNGVCFVPFSVCGAY